MARQVGEECAAAIGTNHEDQGDRMGQKSRHRKMDDTNNQIGRELGRRPEDCANLCVGALEGDLDPPLVVVNPD
jgi:hypothetical protein